MEKSINKKGVGAILRIESFEDLRNLQKLGYYAYGLSGANKKPFVVLSKK